MANQSDAALLKRLTTNLVEIKRMFVQPEQRGQSIGRLVLEELENWAAELEFKSARLETSKRLEPAVNLYRTSGYKFTPNYPPYDGVEDSVCMAKALQQGR